MSFTMTATQHTSTTQTPLPISALTSSSPASTRISNSKDTRPSLPRRSSSLHKLLITKLRPLPFQYLWSVWHSKSSSKINPQTFQDDYQLRTLVDSVADIGTFYRVFNNLPWDTVRQKDSIHIFRAGVRPLWEDEENLNGGRWLIRVRPDENEVCVEEERDERRKDVRAWEELCLLCLGGELQAAISQGKLRHYQQTAVQST